MLLYTGFLYLILVGLFALLNEADLFIGFLWVIDLGVGLVFFIFVLHFTSFLFQKSEFNISSKLLFNSVLFSILFIFFNYYLAQPIDNQTNNDLEKVWYFKVSYLDYYKLLNMSEVSDLNTLKDLYFLSNSFEFFLINFSLFFGLITSIILYFIIHKIFNFLNFSQIIDINFISKIDTSFFIKNQDYIRQTNTTTVTRSWLKKKS